MSDKLYLKDAPAAPEAAKPKPTTTFYVDPVEYRYTPLANIGEDDGENPGDENLPFVPVERPLLGRLPEPESGSLEEAIVRLRRATRDAEDMFWPGD